MPFRGIPLTILDSIYLRLDTANDPLTAPLIINPADGTADPLWQLKTTGVNQYGLDMGTWDLTGLGFGKVLSLIPTTNGPFGNGLALIESAFIVGDAYSPALVGQSIGFLQESTLQTILLTVNWDYDGLGSNRLQVGDMLYAGGGLQIVGDLNLQAGAKLFVTNTGEILFEGQNGFDTHSQMYWNGGNFNLQFYDDGLSGAWGMEGNYFVTPSGLYSIDGSSFNFIALDWGGDARMYYSGYLRSPQNAGATAHYFTATGSDLPDDGWFMRGYHMASWGHVFGITSKGSLEIGSEETANDYDTYLKVRGKDNSFIFTLDNGAGGMEMEFGANKTFKLKDVVYNDLYFPTATGKQDSSHIPTWTAYSTNLKSYTFAIDDYIDLQSNEVLHNYKENTDLDAHIHIITNGLEAVDTKARYRLFYAIGNANETMSAEATLSGEALIPANTADRTHIYIDCGDIDGINAKIGTLVKLRVKRIDNSDHPTHATYAEPNVDPFVEMVGIHYQIDTLGSRYETTK